MTTSDVRPTRGSMERLDAEAVICAEGWLSELCDRVLVMYAGRRRGAA